MEKLRRVFAGLLILMSLFFYIPGLAENNRPTDGYDETHPEDLKLDQIKAESAILIDVSTGQPLFEKNADTQRYPASTTKIMTLLLGVMTMGEDEERLITASQSCLTVEGDTEGDSSMLPLTPGQEIKFSDLLKATRVFSANDGANLIAETVSGSQDQFVALMNETAARYGCQGTHFANAHGYHNDWHYSTARDLAIIAKEAMGFEKFRELAKMTSFTLPPNNANKGRSAVSHDHKFLSLVEKEEKYYYPYATGIKTGRHSLAGSCYVTSASRDGIDLIAVILKDTTYNQCLRDAKRLFEYGFSQFSTSTVENIYKQNPKVIDIASYALDDPMLGRLALDIRKVDETANDHLVSMVGQKDRQMQVYAARTTIQFQRTLEAPVAQGEVMAVMTYTPENGGDPVEYELIAQRSVERRPSLAPSLDEIRTYTDNDPNPFPRFSAELAVIFLIPVLAVIALSQLFYKLFTRKRKQRLKQKGKTRTRYYR